MPLQTGERAFHKVQMGAEVTEGSPVPGIFLYPAESASEPDLNRAPNTPSEDYGELANAHPGRSNFGVRESSFSLRSEMRFDDLMSLFEMAIGGGQSPDGDPDTWTYPVDNDADTLVSRTFEVGDNLTQYQVPGALCTRLRLSYSALKPGSAAPWSVEATMVGYDKKSIVGFTANPTVQDAPETAMGHLTRMFYGPADTDFDALAQLTHALVALDITIDTGVMLRKQGGTDDRPDGHGRGKVAVTFTALLESIAATKTQVWDVFESDAVNPAIPDRRVRWLVTGSPLSGTNEVETVNIGSPSAGTFTLSFGGHTTDDIAFDAHAVDVKNALMALPSIGYNNVAVTGLPGGPWTVTFINELGYMPQALMTGSIAGLTGGALTITQGTLGVLAVLKALYIDGTVEVTALPVQESDGATRYAMTGQFVKDDDLSSIAQFTLVNGVSALPDVPA
jgi:hypothetical protein